MSYYRDIYLKSDEWKSLRKEKILKDGFRCRICGTRPKRKNRKFGEGFQVHHLKYKNLYDVEMGDLRTLCVECHAKVHKLMKKYPKMKNLTRALQWKTVVYHLCPDQRQMLAGMVKGLGVDHKPCKQTKATHGDRPALVRFSDIKRGLFESGLICKQRMKWRDSFNKNSKIISALKSPEMLIQAYLDVTMQDPRRLIPVIYDPTFASTLAVAFRF